MTDEQILTYMDSQFPTKSEWNRIRKAIKEKNYFSW